MGVIIKQSMRGTILSYLGAFLGYANWVIIFPLFLNKHEMGFIRILMDAALLLATIFGFGIPQATVKFYPYGNEKFSKSFFARFAAITFGAILLYIPVFFIFQNPLKSFFAERAEFFNDYVWALLPIVVLCMVYDFFEAVNRVRFNISSAVFIREILLRLTVMAFIFGFGFKLYSFDVLVILIVLAYVIQAVAMSGIFFARWNPDESSLKPSKPSMEQFKYMSLLFLGTGGTMIVNQIDSVMTGGMKGLDYAAVYAMAFFMSSFVFMPYRSVNSISATVISEYFNKNDMEGMRRIYKASSIGLFLIGAIIFLGIWLNIDFIFSFIPDKGDSEVKFSDGKWVFFLLGLARLFDMLMGINGMILVNSRYYLANIITMPLLAGMVIVSNYFLIPILGIEGAALSALLSVMVFNLIRYIIIYVKLGMQPFTWKNAISIVLFAAIIGIGYLFSFENHYLQIAYSGILILLLFCLPSYWLKFSPEINHTIYTLVKKYVKK